jgi:hypothetical protein
MSPSRDYWFRYMLEMDRYTSAKTPYERNRCLSYANGFLRLWFAVTESEMNATLKARERRGSLGNRLSK